jgi:hypothetical protein
MNRVVDQESLGKEHYEIVDGFQQLGWEKVSYQFEKKMGRITFDTVRSISLA